jgi:hypothetical protein
VQYALDRKNSAVGAGASRGDFMGYSEDGNAINLKEVPDEYIEKIFYEYNGK